ncbi:OmpA family protein [Bacteroides heparinolyticus]|uniref:OmpA family protein n=1 Tax=Prevotella heparinolytica TaxID=28113 RepID=UPI0035A10139
MKKGFLAAALLAVTLGASAQSALSGAKFWDGWSLGVTGGVQSDKTVGSNKHFRGLVGLEIGKQFTPIFGLSAEGLAGINTTGDPKSFDHINATLLNRVNLNNLFGGYAGKPRVFEVEAVGGIGYAHIFNSNDRNGHALNAKVGLNLNFNLGASRAWTFSLKPALVYGLAESDGYTSATSKMNIDNSYIQLLAGLTYHFKGSNGLRYMTYVREYDQEEVDRLNADINGLRAEVASKDDALNSNASTIAQLRKELEDCRNKPAQVITQSNEPIEAIVAYRQGSSVVDKTQLVQIERIATYLKNNADSKVVIKGYTSPEGSKRFNDRLSKRRAESIKKILVKRYKISADRISTSGEGVGSIFSEPTWNRVSISTVER